MGFPVAGYSHLLYSVLFFRGPNGDVLQHVAFLHAIGDFSQLTLRLFPMQFG